MQKIVVVYGSKWGLVETLHEPRLSDSIISVFMFQDSKF